LRWLPSIDCKSPAPLPFVPAIVSDTPEMQLMQAIR
jgi:hypothetical protein